MSILIRNLNLPPISDTNDIINITIDCYGKVIVYTYPIKILKAEQLPLHGRLIDADAFIKDECNNCDGACEAIPCDCLNCKADCRCNFIKDIADAPTIIEAEE